ncbi:MAG: rhomboid family intramembrane serine protease [Lachnospiraceae bacterium]
MKESIATFLFQKGFNSIIPSGDTDIITIANLLSVTKMEDLKIICVVNADTKNGRNGRIFRNVDRLNESLGESEFRNETEQNPEKLFPGQDREQNHREDVLNLVIGAHSREALEYCKSKSNCWYLDKVDRKIYLFDNQISDFHNLRKDLEKWIEQKGIEFPKEIQANTVKSFSVPALVISTVCIVVFFLFTVGLLNPQYMVLNIFTLVQDNEWYRLLTYSLSHTGVAHLMMNLLMLNVISPYTEKYYGKVVYVIGYLISGVVAGLFSMAYSNYFENFYSTLGASGAIYGLVGMTLFSVVINWRQFNNSFWGRLIFAIVIVLLGGLTSSGVDHFAHIGGFLSGFAIGAIVTGIRHLLKPKRKIGKKGVIENYEN